jgi:predicted RNA-binding protein (virulence factor B family)
MEPNEKPNPYQVGEYALLRVVSVEQIGAFLDWGLPKDLFLPFAEQIDDLRVGEDILVYIYLDKADRMTASMRLSRNKEKFPITFKEGDSVDLIIARRTDLGYQAIIGKQHMGMIFNNEVFQPLEYGQKIKGFIRKIRDDGKIDLSLQAGVTGHKAAAGIDQKILDLLNAKDGFLPIHTKTPPEAIYGLFGVSKKLFKIALSDLYKKRVITIDEDGIRLVKKADQ